MYVSDIDECAERPGICQSYQTCVNSYGFYRCVDPIDRSMLQILIRVLRELVSIRTTKSV